MTRGKLGVLLAAAAAYGYYRYSKMTPEQKNNLRSKGKGFADKYLGNLGNMFGKTKQPANGSY